jgi:hypothetical protein
MQETEPSIEWHPVAVLPALSLGTTIEVGYAALVPSTDPRVAAIEAAQPIFRTFMSRFTDAFGVRVQPAVLLIHRQTPSSFRSNGSLVSLRDAIAVSTVTYARAREIAALRGHRIGFADAFAFYPWMVDRHYQHLVAITPALKAMHEVTRFRGQPAPGIPEADMCDLDRDRPLLEELLRRWSRCFSASEPCWADTALFRSLNMAHQACLMLTPAADTRLYDLGRQMALWVSACEILGHPGPGGRTSRNAVLDLLDRVQWMYRDCRAKRYPIRSGNKGEHRRLAPALYARLHQARNDFLHGNPVSMAQLKLRNSDDGLFQVAAPLYRLALTAFLDLHPPALGSDLDSASFGPELAARWEFERYQGRHEEALLAAWYGRDGLEARLLRRARKPLPDAARRGSA